MARLISHQLLLPAAWKNGAGSTTELAVYPAGAGFADFDWRVSLATIARSGPFSAFPGIERSLALVAGDPVQLAIDGAAAATLDAHSAPVRFAGEAEVYASTAGSSTDFNLMTRRGRCRHQLARLLAPQRVTRRAPVTLVFLAAGAPVTLGCQFRLNRYDALLLDARDGADWRIDGGTDSTLLVAEIFDAANDDGGTHG